MDDTWEERGLFVQDCPAGRKELSVNSSYYSSFRQRAFLASDISEIFHENTKFDRGYLHRSSLTRKDLPNNLSAVEHDYHGKDIIPLPESKPLRRELGQVLHRRRSVRTFRDEGISKQTLGTVLDHSIGPTARTDRGDRVETFRPYPSAGGLFPVETYVEVLNGRDIDQGLYYYSPEKHGLRVFDRGFEQGAKEFTGNFMDADFSRRIVSQSGIVFVLTGSFGRVKAKYGPAGYRFALMEAGHVAQNLLLAAQALNLGGVPIGSFIDRDLDSFLGVDGVNESALYTVAIGHPTANE